MLLPRYRVEQPTDRRISTALAQIENRDQAAATAVKRRIDPPDATDSERLRGIPCIAQGVGGTSPGTHPLSELLRNDRKQRYHLRNR